MWSSFFGNANLSNLSGTLLEGNEDHLLSQARSDLARTELHVESLKKCIGDIQNERRHKPGHQRTLTTDLWKLVVARGIVTKGESSSRYEDSKFSIPKLRENHETIQQLTSQLQQLQEQMNSMNSSGEFQDIESNYSGRLSHVSSQREMIPSSRASAQPRQKIAA